MIEQFFKQDFTVRQLLEILELRRRKTGAEYRILYGDMHWFYVVGRHEVSGLL